MANQIFGWFSHATQTEPVHDPAHDAPCLFCGEPIFAADVRTISLMWGNRQDERSYFYRAHSTCHDLASKADREKIDGVVLDMILRACGET